MAATKDQTVKFSRKGKHRITTEDAVSYQADACFVFEMKTTKHELDQELEAWEAASDEALNLFEEGLEGSD